MILPSQLLTAILDKLNAAKDTIGITAAIELTGDEPGDSVVPPYATAFEDFTQESTNVDAHDVNSVTVDISIVFWSKECKTAQEAIANCFAMARAAKKIIRGTYQINTGGDSLEKVTLKPKPLFLQELDKTASNAAIRINYYYEMYFNE